VNHVKSSDSTWHTVTPAQFSGYPVSTIDVVNCQRLFQQLARNTDNCLRYLLPDMRDSSIITNQLRSANKFPLIFAKTNNNCKNSFICYGLSHYQLIAWHSRIFVSYLQCMLYCTNPASGCHTLINSIVINPQWPIQRRCRMQKSSPRRILRRRIFYRCIPNIKSKAERFV